MATKIKPTFDIDGNTIRAVTVLDAVKVNEDTEETVRYMMEHIMTEIDVNINNVGWTQKHTDYYEYYKDINVEKITEEDNPFYTLYPNNGISATEEEAIEYEKIKVLETMDGKIRICTTEPIVTPITITLRCIPRRP